MSKIPLFQKLHLGLAGLLVLPLVIGGLAEIRNAEAGAPPANWTHRDKVHKFSLRMLRDYKQVPLKTDEKVTVCKFRDPKSKGNQRGTYDPEVEVVKYNIKGKGGPVLTGDIPKELARFFRGDNPTNIWDATVNDLWLDAAGKGTIKRAKKEFKKIKSKDKPKLEGKLWQFELPLAQGGGLHITLAEFVKDDWAYGLYMNCGKPLAKSYAPRFKQIAKSFKYFDSRAKDVERIDDLEGVNITAKKRTEIEKSMVKGWDVVVSGKQNYIVIYNTKRGTNNYLAKVIAKRIELIREQIYEVQFPPAKPIKDVCIVRVCGSAREYRAYGGPGGSAGYWSPGDEELVFYDASASKKPDDDTLAVLYHEAFHQYIHYSVGRVAPHSWFNEGHGDYYAGAKLKGKKFKIGPFNWRVSTIKKAIGQGERPYEENVDDDTGKVTRSWEPKGYTPLEHLVRFTQREYYSYPGVCYAQGWSLIYFLREIVPKNKKYREKWGHILDVYFNTLKAEVNKDKSKDDKGKGDGPDDDEGEDDAPPPTTPREDEDEDPPRNGDDDDDPADSDPADEDEDEDEDEDGDGDEKGGNFAPAMTRFRGRGGPEALRKAVDAAFKGIDWAEFQEAWRKATKKGK